MSYLKLTTLLFVLLVNTPCLTFGREGTSEKQTVAFLPLKNYTGKQKAYDLSVKKITHSMQTAGFDLIAPSELRPVLRKYRIRSTGSISAIQAEKIITATSANMILVGSIGFFKDDGTLQYGLSLRLIDSKNLDILSVASGSATGRDFVGLFGRGEIKNHDSLVRLITNEVIKKLSTQLEIAQKTKQPIDESRSVAIIPFENISKNRNAGHIAADWLVSELVSSGYKLIEPGIVAALLLDNGGLPAGEIDLPRIKLLKEKLGVGLIITGQVDIFRETRGVSPNSRPELSWGARFIDTNSGLVLHTYESEQNGGDYTTIFGAGTCLALGKLLEKSFDSMINENNIRMNQYEIQ